ncbi:hypothetical protein QJQ45_017017, partial [Haematococcus lacustris]
RVTADPASRDGSHSRDSPDDAKRQSLPEKAREAMAQRRAAEAEAKAQALAAEAEAKAQADAGAYEAQLHQLQADLQQREQQVADTQRLQHAQQQLHDIQREEIQRKEQQVVEQQHQLQQQQADLHLREQCGAELQRLNCNSAAPTVSLTTSNRFATLSEADEHEQQLPSQPAKMDEHQAAAAAIAAAAVATVLRAAARAEAAGAAGSVARARANAGAMGRDKAMRRTRGNPTPAIPHPPCPAQALSPRPVWDLRTHRQQQQQQQQPLSPSPQAWQRRLQPMLDEFQRYTVEEGAELLDRLQQHRRMRSVVSQATGVVPPTPDQVLGGIMVDSLRPVLASTNSAPGGQRTTQQQPFNTALAMTMGRGIEQHGIKRTARQLGITPHAVKRAMMGWVMGGMMERDWANKHFAVPCHAQDTSASHRQRGHIMRRSYLVLDVARQTTICSMPEADVERMHDDVAGCRAMHRMVFTPDREQPKWAMAACACSTCMSVPCLPCMKPDTTTPLKPMPMFQDTVKEVREDEECYALLMLFHPDLLHDEVCFGKLTNTHCARYRMHMGWKREEGRRELRRLVRRELQSEQLEAEYEADNCYGWV